jgi:hypothetical protein
MEDGVHGDPEELNVRNNVRTRRLEARRILETPGAVEDLIARWSGGTVGLPAQFVERRFLSPT